MKNKCPNCGSKISYKYEQHFFIIYKCGSVYNYYIKPPEYISTRCLFIRLKNSIKDLLFKFKFFLDKITHNK